MVYLEISCIFTLLSNLNTSKQLCTISFVLLNCCMTQSIFRKSRKKKKKNETIVIICLCVCYLHVRKFKWHQKRKYRRADNCNSP